MYTDYWKLKEKPFENNYDARFLFRSQQYEEALTRLTYAIQERGPGMILTGEYGTGKSIVMKCFLASLDQLDGRFRSIYVSDPLLTTMEFYREFLHQLGADQGVDHTSRQQLSVALRNTLTNLHNQGTHVVIAIDEANLIEESTLEQMRLLLDMHHPQTHGRLVSLLLCGRFPEDSEWLNGSALRQRLPILFRLRGLTEEEVAAYVRHRRKMAGQPNDLFTDEALRLIAQRSRGIPRSINNICDLALFLGCARRLPVIDADIIEVVTQEIEGALK